MAKSKSKKKTTPPKKKSDESRFLARLKSVFRPWRVIKVLAALGAIIVLIPILLTLLYRNEWVRPISTLMVADYLTGQSVSRDWRPIDEISDNLKNSVLMSEDGKFCAHDGIDWDALNNVVENVLEGERTRGASTLTMQTVKNLFLWNGRSYVRKALEIPLALWFDFAVPKRRIFEIYLNIAEWDTGVYGIEAATQQYFSKSAKSMTRQQAALLTVTLPNPRNRSPAKPSKRMQRVAKIIETRAKAAGAYIACLK